MTHLKTYVVSIVTSGFILKNYVKLLTIMSVVKSVVKSWSQQMQKNTAKIFSVGL